MNRWRLAGLGLALAASAGTVWAWGATEAEAPRAVALNDGAALFRAKGCASCHLDNETFPDLSDASTWAGERRPGMSAEAYIAESLRDPGAFISPAFRQGSAGPTTGMPALALTDAEIDALVEYLLEGCVDPA